ncbi:DUF1330 domain-containing protein [Amycolatopsis jejuensis]|uniref:DUF1330 domain-containing protein n=1 Tax=Amycolatopsis jejuensis TaxID=330084 RepID=UPI0005266BD0|nr:DUF1330 domain-containing protein [Amycolatopsis jejuensis]
MPAFVIANIAVHDPENYEEYRRDSPPLTAEFGGRYLVKGGETVSLEGDWRPNRFVLIEFADLEQARRWYTSDRYAPLRGVRQRTADTQLLLADGFAEPH